MTETVARPQLSDRYTATSGRVQLTGSRPWPGCPSTSTGATWPPG
jgi:hypothetical protein